MKLFLTSLLICLSLAAATDGVTLSTYGTWPLCPVSPAYCAKSPADFGNYILFVKITDPTVAKYEYQIVFQVEGSPDPVIKAGELLAVDSGYGYANVVLNVGAKVTAFTYTIKSLKESEIRTGSNP